MLSPDYLDSAPTPLLQLMQQVEDDILRDVARRIGKMDGMTDTAQWQLWRLSQIHAVQQDVVATLAKYSGKTEAQIRAILQAAGTETLSTDDAIYREAGLSPSPAEESPALVNLLNAGYRQTRGTWKNLTATTANTVTGQFEQALDRAWLQVSSGAFDYQTAIKRAVDDLAQNMTHITYPTGHRDTLEVAARRAVLTGVNQTAGKLQVARMDEIGCEFVEVTAHSGSRPAHAAWQGKVYHRGKAVTYQGERYPCFETATGYGTGGGLCGWNCRHNFYPYFPGLSQRAYTDQELQKLNAREYEYQGKLYTKYELSQIQRGLERKVRSAKKQYLAEDAAGLDSTQAAVKYRSAQDALKRFCRETGFPLDSSRTGKAGFGHSQASKAIWQVRKELQRVFETAQDGDTIELSQVQEDILASLTFEEIRPMVGKLPDRAVRRWYIHQDSLIPGQIDYSLTLEGQARMAYELRNQNRTRARDLMKDQEKRNELDKSDPNITFEQLLSRKMNRGLSREEALSDIIRSATKTRTSVNKSLGLE